jgi:hypothetical protein
MQPIPRRQFTYVSIDDQGRPQAIKQGDQPIVT